MSAAAATLIGTTIHDERVEVITGRRYASVRQDGQAPRPFATAEQAFKFARSLVPAHRYAELEAAR